MKNLIFDWSGVVKDSVKSHLWIVNRMFAKYGRNEMTLEELRENWTQPYMNFYSKYIPGVSLEEEQKDYRELVFDKDCPETKSYPGICELLKKLKKENLFMAVVTSDFPDTMLAEMKKYGLENVFSEIVTNVHEKEDAVRDLIQKFNLDPEDTYFIGDSNHEIEAGKLVGIKTIAVTWGFCTEETLKSDNPDYLVHDIAELEKVLLN